MYNHKLANFMFNAKSFLIELLENSNHSMSPSYVSHGKYFITPPLPPHTPPNTHSWKSLYVNKGSLLNVSVNIGLHCGSSSHVLDNEYSVSITRYQHIHEYIKYMWSQWIPKFYQEMDGDKKSISCCYTQEVWGKNGKETQDNDISVYGTIFLDLWIR